MVTLAYFVTKWLAGKAQKRLIASIESACVLFVALMRLANASGWFGFGPVMTCRIEIRIFQEHYVSRIQRDLSS